jgi:hypothetical protein
MKISECTYCGMTAITDRDICTSCAELLFPENELAAAAQNVAPPEINPFQQAPPDLAPVLTAPNNNYVPQPVPSQPVENQTFPSQPVENQTFPNRTIANRAFPNRGGHPDSHQTPPVMDARCVRCKIAVPRGQSQCFDCQNKKSAPFKSIVVFSIFAVIGFFGFNYVYEQVSPHGTFRKYAKTTGADDSLIFENYILKGEAAVTVDAPISFTSNGISGGGRKTEGFSFKMIFKKPNISSIEFMRDDSSGNATVFKQVYDGARGWKYTNMPNQRAGYQDTDDAFATKKLGMGLDEYDSLEFMNEASAPEFGKGNIKSLTDIKEIEVADISKPSGEKTLILGKQKRNGKTESSLLVFDRQTGLLLGIIKNAMTGDLLLTTVIRLDKYTKFPVKRKGLFGVEETRVLMPTRLSFVMRANNSSQVNGMPEITIELNVKNFEVDASLEDNYFQKQ